MRHNTYDDGTGFKTAHYFFKDRVSRYEMPVAYTDQLSILLNSCDLSQVFLKETVNTLLYEICMFFYFLSNRMPAWNLSCCNLVVESKVYIMVYNGLIHIKWARACENVSYATCEQQRYRSACASVQSDQHLCCSRLR